MILKVFLWFACNSDVLKSCFYCRKTSIFKVLHTSYIIKTMSFIIILSICCSILKSFLSHFRILFGVNVLHWFLFFFWSESDAQIRSKMSPNRPQCVPGRRLASWLHPVIFGHTIFTISDAKMAPKMTYKLTNRAPNGAQDHQNIALSSKRSLWHRPFGRFGPHLLLMV